MNSGFEQTIERLAMDADIRDLAARFSGAVNRHDFNAFGDLFADDGAWEIGEPFPSGAAGRQNVTTMFKNLWAPWDFFFQMTHSGVRLLTACGGSPSGATTTSGSAALISEVALSPPG